MENVYCRWLNHDKDVELCLTSCLYGLWRRLNRFEVTVLNMTHVGKGTGLVLADLKCPRAFDSTQHPPTAFVV